MSRGGRLLRGGHSSREEAVHLEEAVGRREQAIGQREEAVGQREEAVGQREQAVD